MHELIRHLHPLVAVINVIALSYKFWRSYLTSDYQITKLAKIIGRITDVLLLLTGLILAYGIGSSLVFDVKWFDLKLILVVVYIIMGILCLKSIRRSKASLVYYWIAMACVVGIFFLVKVQPF